MGNTGLEVMKVSEGAYKLEVGRSNHHAALIGQRQKALGTMRELRIVRP